MFSLRMAALSSFKGQYMAPVNWQQHYGLHQNWEDWKNVAWNDQYADGNTSNPLLGLLVLCEKHF